MEGRRIYLLRHGETLYQSEANEGAIGNGALTERGREQIAAAALLFRGVSIDRVYASPLARAHETASIIAKEKGLDVLVSADLREITPSAELIASKSVAEVFQEIQQFFKSHARVVSHRQSFCCRCPTDCVHVHTAVIEEAGSSRVFVLGAELD